MIHTKRISGDLSRVRERKLFVASVFFLLSHGAEIGVERQMRYEVTRARFHPDIHSLVTRKPVTHIRHLIKIVFCISGDEKAIRRQKKLFFLLDVERTKKSFLRNKFSSSIIIKL